MKKEGLISVFSAVLFSIFLSIFSSCSQDTLNLYSIIPDEETQALCDMFTEQTGIPVRFLRASTGELVNRVISEKNNPKADILLGGARNYHIQADKEGALESYYSPNAANVPEYALSDDRTWTGFCVLTLAIGINNERFAKLYGDSNKPQTWEDLLNPSYKGELVFTNPVASSTGYLFLQNQLQRLGWDNGWDYLVKLADNVAQFSDSGSSPAKFLGSGEYALGISYVHLLSRYKANGFNLDVIVPPESVADVDCIAIMKNTKKLEQAKKFVDFMLSPEAQTLMCSIDYTLPVNPDAKIPEASIPLSELKLFNYDIQVAASQKDQVLGEWTKKVK